MSEHPRGEFGGARAIRNPAVLDYLTRNVQGDFIVNALADEEIADRFVRNYRRWLNASKLNQFTGLDKFGFHAYSQGTTESFDKLYMTGHRIRTLPGEYRYHSFAPPDYALLLGSGLIAGDVVVLSVPFRASGEILRDTWNLLDECADKEIPVMIDGAFLGVCYGVEFDFSHPAIQWVTTSLSKSFPVEHARIGMRLARTYTEDDGINAYQGRGYENRLGAAIGNLLIKQFDCDYNSRIFGPVQTAICMHDLKGTKVSNTVLFALGDDQYKEYDRDGYNRLYLGGLYEKDIADGSLRLSGIEAAPALSDQ